MDITDIVYNELGKRDIKINRADGKKEIISQKRKESKKEPFTLLINIIQYTEQKKKM